MDQLPLYSLHRSGRVPHILDIPPPQVRTIEGKAKGRHCSLVPFMSSFYEIGIHCIGVVGFLIF